MKNMAKFGHSTNRVPINSGHGLHCRPSTPNPMSWRRELPDTARIYAYEREYGTHEKTVMTHHSVRNRRTEQSNLAPGGNRLQTHCST